MIRCTKFPIYHGEPVTLTRISLVDARYFYNLGCDIYIMKDFDEFYEKSDLRLFFNANKKQGIKDFDTVCKVFRSRNKIKKYKTLLYFLLE